MIEAKIFIAGCPSYRQSSPFLRAWDRLQKWPGFTTPKAKLIKTIMNINIPDELEQFLKIFFVFIMSLNHFLSTYVSLLIIIIIIKSR